MAWASLVLELDAAEADALSDKLLELGALSVTTEDAAAGSADEKAIFDEPGEGAASWPRLRMRVLAEDAGQGRQLLARAGAALDMTGLAEAAVEIVEDLDWVRVTQGQFEPQRISDRLWIVPSWHQAPDPKAINIRLDPGLAFGTGSHPTTRLCLQWLEQSVQGGEAVLDYGCGSGILAIAALKLGAGQALGVDVDAKALEAARANCAVNAVRCEFADAAAPITIKADLVVANILANPLKLLAPALAGYTRPGGRLALAGILAHQAGELIGIYQPWFELDPLAEMDGWVRIAGTRRAIP
ncbi:MAG: ribosomal protein L11 methyltransferase [Betaproteobacteria bacterium RIFCSPLOWO2_02_FULL_62_17]|nr:MAG: ribosomal protein L11 methyltransferase [Betaproteobacteria bacterium RIFCSPLOWO2_02_FULL_62_17]